jgi:hypothetical protein
LPHPLQLIAMHLEICEGTHLAFCEEGALRLRFGAWQIAKRFLLISSCGVPICRAPCT